jgi:hypothetical protein
MTTSMYLDVMDDMALTREQLNRKLKDAIATDPLTALTVIGEIQRDLETHERAAVRAAIQHHSWTEIGAALGVSKQGAHQRLAKAWATQMKDEVKAASKAYATARRMGNSEEASAALARRDALLAELKNANRRKKAA